jgi:ABC-type dipeptide/oligopeptide/nickel transport system permease component
MGTRDARLRPQTVLLVPLTFVGITFVAFCFTRFVPGGPIEQAMAERQQAENRKQTSAARPSGPASPEELDNLRRRYGFDRPLLQAYAIWLGALPGPADWSPCDSTKTARPMPTSPMSKRQARP